MDIEMMMRIPACPHSDKEKLSPRLLSLIRAIEFFLQRQVTFTSGIRCPICNKKANGSPTSEHLKGYAVDIRVRNSMERIEVVRAALQVGCNRVGVNKGFVHVGVSKSHPSPVLWLY